MSKGLSLKKAHQKGPPQNQKAITQFFISTGSGNSQKTEGLPLKNADRPSKRKASSPTLVDEIELLDKKELNNVKKEVKSSKKIRTHDFKGSSSKAASHKSPNKENGAIHNISPIKEFNTKKLSQKASEKILTKSSNEREELTNSLEHTSPKSPLRLVYTENVQEKNHNHVKDQYFDQKSCVKNSVDELLRSPVKKSPHKNHDKVSDSRKSTTPKKSLIKEFHCSPVAKLVTPEKTLEVLLSPSKYGSTVKSLDFGQDDVGFDEEWDMDGFDEEQTEDLDLSSLQRCEIISANKTGCRIELKLKNDRNKGTCFVEGIWLDTPLTPGDKVSVLASKDTAGQYSIGNTSGLLVLRPDHLVSSTSVVAGVFCKRKAVLQERWRGIDSANTAMTIGILIHELVQKALTQNISSLARLRLEVDLIIKESVQSLYDAGITEEETRNNMQLYIGPLAEFMQNYVVGKQQAPKGKDNWNGHVDKVLDIEENLCCPQLGLKGKIDATLQVTIHDRKGDQTATVPLELKSGKASVSAEHRGQVVLYGMMLSLLRSEDPTLTVQRGLLLYLKEQVNLREVSCGYPERRDLIMLRNELVQYLTPSPDEIDPETLVDIEDASDLLQQRLPEPVNHHNACAKCPYLTLCQLHLWHTDGPSVSDTHPLSKLRTEATGHLTATHIEYFLHWTALLRIEERGQMLASPLHALWTDSDEKRAKRGSCASKLKLKTVKPSSDRYLHTFERSTYTANNDNKPPCGPQEGEFSIVSIENRPWVAAGVVSLSTQKEITILLERDLSRRQHKGTQFCIDTYESYATTVQNLTNLGVLMEDSERAERLRKLIIDKVPPEFEKKLPREVGRLGSKLMRSLNIEQQRAVLKAVTANDYVLLQGLPGTGKTQTISVLIQILVGLKQRVLVTAHTHSAVDTVLCRLPETMRIMRLGSSARVAPSLAKRSELSLIAQCDTPEQLAHVYDSMHHLGVYNTRLPETMRIMRLGSSARMAPSLAKRSELSLIAQCDTPEQLAHVYDFMEVVGVTCLGAAHAMLTKTTFDICIVDEATQVLQSTVLRPLFAAKRFVLVGDPEQLPPVVRSRAARRLGMEESLFHRLMSEQATSTLQLQYRMNRALADIANKVAYNDRLKCADDKVANAKMQVNPQKTTLFEDTPWLQSVCSIEAEDAALFLDMPPYSSGDGNKSIANEEEALVVLALVEALNQIGVSPSDIGIIAPYRDQVSLLRRSITSVEASTVDQFQGRDKSVIIYSCTKKDGDDRKVKEGEILNDQRRLAVSVTRAKHKLLIVGSARALQKYAPVQALINACKIIQLDPSLVSRLRIKYKNVVS